MQVLFTNDNSIHLTIESKIYSLEVIHKCFYWYSNICSIDISSNGDYYEVELKDIKWDKPREEFIIQIKRDLIDFKTREIVQKETNNIREMLIAKAFSHEDDLDQLPPGKISDPIGFNPKTV